MQNKVKKMIAILILLASLGMLGFLFRAEWMVYVIDPIGRFLWAVWGILCRLDQNILWNFLIFLAAAMAFLLFPSTRYESQNSAYTYDYRSDALTAYWNSLLRKRNLDLDGEQALNQAVKKLCLEYLDLETGHVARDRLDTVKARMPAGVAQSLGFQPKPKAFRFQKLLFKANFLAPSFLRKLTMNRKSSVPSDFMEMIEWLEIELGIEKLGDDK